MEHQDWNQVTLNNPVEKKRIEKSTQAQKAISRKEFNSETTKLEVPKDLGKEIAKARTMKKLTQEQLGVEVKISKQIINRWEANKETPTNADIAKLEKFLNIKLPRCKKVKLENTQ